MAQNPRRDLRVANLRREVEEAGGPAGFVKQHPTVDASYVSQVLNGHRPLGDEAAAKMEERCGWPLGYLDRPAGAPRVTEPIVDQPAEPLLQDRIGDAIDFLRACVAALPPTARPLSIEGAKRFLETGEPGVRTQAILLLLPASPDARVAKFIKPAKSTATAPVKNNDDDQLV